MEVVVLIISAIKDLPNTKHFTCLNVFFTKYLYDFLCIIDDSFTYQKDYFDL